SRPARTSSGSSSSSHHSIKSSCNASAPRASRRGCRAMDNKIFIVAKREYLERVRSRWFIISTLVLPVLFAGAMIMTVTLAARSKATTGAKHITIIDVTGAGLGDRVARALNTDSTLSDGKGADTVQARVVAVTRDQLAAAETEATAEVKKPNHIAG